jgi:hypothetical protein
VATKKKSGRKIFDFKKSHKKHFSEVFGGENFFRVCGPVVMFCIFSTFFPGWDSQAAKFEKRKPQ